MEIYLIRHSTPLIEPDAATAIGRAPAPSFAAEWAAIQPTFRQRLTTSSAVPCNAAANG
jgi:hypothetical protein